MVCKLEGCANLKSVQSQGLYTFRRFTTLKGIQVQKMYNGSQKQSLLGNGIGAAAWRDLFDLFSQKAQYDLILCDPIPAHYLPLIPKITLLRRTFLRKSE